MPPAPRERARDSRELLGRLSGEFRLAALAREPALEYADRIRIEVLDRSTRGWLRGEIGPAACQQQPSELRPGERLAFLAHSDLPDPLGCRVRRETPRDPYQQQAPLGFDQLFDVDQHVRLRSVVDASTQLANVGARRNSVDGLGPRSLAVGDPQDDHPAPSIGEADDGLPELSQLRVAGRRVRVPRLALEGLGLDGVRRRAIELPEQRAYLDRCHPPDNRSFSYCVNTIRYGRKQCRGAHALPARARRTPSRYARSSASCGRGVSFNRMSVRGLATGIHTPWRSMSSASRAASS